MLITTVLLPMTHIIQPINNCLILPTNLLATTSTIMALLIRWLPKGTKEISKWKHLCAISGLKREAALMEPNASLLTELLSWDVTSMRILIKQRSAMLSSRKGFVRMASDAISRMCPSWTGSSQLANLNKPVSN